MSVIESGVPAASDLEAQVAFYRANSYVILPDLLSAEQVAALNEAMDRDREQNPFMWFCTTQRDYNCNLLLTEPIFELTIRQPALLQLVERLMGGPCCFEELAVRHTPPSPETKPTGWHRDRPHWPEHPLHLDYPQVIYYLTDVDEGTHCFTISPEPADGEVLERDAQIERGGAFYFHGRAGSAILFNAAALHGVTLRQSTRHRRIVQVYYGHPERPSLSEVTLIPPRLWRDHPEPEIRRFYGKRNRYNRVMDQALGIESGPRKVLRQRLLYLHAATPSIRSQVVGMALHEPVPGSRTEIDPAPREWPYATVHDAVLDGWQVIHFPQQLAPFDDREIDVLGYEFVLQKLEAYDG
jgi:ectoine hydroxylase-related dioxygenase (phytanoyl-CoA dioxygenase family)